MSEHRDMYAGTLDNLRVLAQRDLLAWWKRTEGLGFVEQKRLLVEPFAAIVEVYGEQAAYAAADYLFLERSLDDTLRELEYPEVVDPVGFEQARTSFQSATWVDDVNDAGKRALALRKLQGITNRLVVDPARRTVGLATLKAGTQYARVPEPGACSFCLMLGSRGAVYSSKTVLSELGRYHDNCRCLAIEVKVDSDLPRINRELIKQHQVISREVGHAAGLNDWRQWVDASRQQTDIGARWPRLKYCRIPSYMRNGISSVFPGEKLPPLGKMPGHVLYGWRDPNEGDKKKLREGKSVRGWPHTESLAEGHRWDSKRKGASKFPRSWTDQMVADAVRDTIEDPQWTRKTGSAREVWRIIDGTVVYAKYVTADGYEQFIMAYPEVKNKIPPRARKVGD